MIKKIIVSLLVTLIFQLYVFATPASVRAMEPVKLYFQPSISSHEPDNEYFQYELVLDQGVQKIAFYRLVMQFDNSVTELAEIEISPSYRTVIRSTDIIAANQEGEIEIIAGLAPSQLESHSQGKVELAKIMFRSSETHSNPAVFNFVENEMQLVSLEERYSDFSTESLSTLTENNIESGLVQIKPASKSRKLDTQLAIWNRSIQLLRYANRGIEID